MTGGHTWMMGGEADGPDALRRKVREMAKLGADYIKVMATGGGTLGTTSWLPSFGLDELRVLADEAHALGRTITAHCLCAEAMDRVVEAGFDGIEHAGFLVDASGRQEFVPAVAERVARAGIPCTSTLAVGEYYLRVLRALPSPTAAERAALARWEGMAADNLAQFRRMRELGVTWVAGTDAGWRHTPIEGMATEIALVARGGMTALEAIAAGTSVAARVSGLPDVGVLAPGKVADVLVVAGRPARRPRPPRRRAPGGAGRESCGCARRHEATSVEGSKEESSFSEEKEAKRLLPVSHRMRTTFGVQWAKVFCFFFSKKKRFLSSCMIPPALLEVRDLRTHFRTRGGTVRAVDGVSLSLARGGSLGVVGESGSGKTITSLSIMRLLEPPGFVAGGEVLLDGQDLLALPESAMRALRGGRLCLVFQDPMTALNPVYTVGDQVAEALTAHRAVGRREATERVVAMFRQLGIPSPERRVREYPHQLSGGLRQRVTIAMAMINEPDLLILDEPTTALDVTIQAQILDLVRELRGRAGTAVLLITHDIGVVEEVCEEVLVMYGGRVMERGATARVTAAPMHPYTRGCSPPARAGRRAAGRWRRSAARCRARCAMPPGCPFQPRCPRAMPVCAEDPGLREVADADGVRHVACWLY